jgi:putative transposase
VDVLKSERGIGITLACGLIGISRSLYVYRSRRPVCTELRERLCELAAEKRRYGYRRIHVLLRREGWQINRKRTIGFTALPAWRSGGGKRKRIAPFERKPLPKASAVNRSWSMDFRRSSTHCGQWRMSAMGSPKLSTAMACSRDV